VSWRQNPAPLDIPCPEFPFNPVDTQGNAADGVDDVSHQKLVLPTRLFPSWVSLTCSNVVLCVLLTDALVFIGWLTVLCFLELPCSVCS
jgi:hypothetical protein